MERIEKRSAKLQKPVMRFTRPSRLQKYESHYADLLYDHLSRGLSFSTFSIEGVCHSTLSQWVISNAEFRHAMVEGSKLRRIMVEEAGLEMLAKGNAAVWKVMLSEYQATENVFVEKAEKVDIDPNSDTPKKLERLARIKSLMAEVIEEEKTVEVLDVSVVDGDDLEDL